MPRRRTTRIYWREQGGDRRAYADFRDFSDIGGRREALVPPGAKTATSNSDVAAELVANRLRTLEERRRTKVILGIERQAGLKSFAAHHLIEKKRSGRVTDDTLEGIEKHLERAAKYFGAGRELNAIGVRDVTGWMNALKSTLNGRGGTLSDKTVRDHLSSLGNLYRRAASEGYVQPGFNPVASLLDKPTATRHEANWLEVHQAALFLESARTYRPPNDKHPLPFIYPLVATFLLTGGRKAEVLGLEVDDVSFDRRTVTFRPNEWRRLKSRSSHRTVPLWPQLEAILREYVFDRPGPAHGLLFPSPRTGGMVMDTRKALDAIGCRAGWNAGEVRTKVFRHTYCATRLQTTDSGAPVSVYTVMRELGHSNQSLVNRIYGHLGEIRQRVEVVEFRADQHAATLGPLLAELLAHG